MSTKSVAKAAGLIAVATILSRALGFLRESLLSGFFGKGFVMDAYNAAFNMPDLFYALFVAGAFASAFIPVMSGYFARGDYEEAWEVASSVINLALLILCSLTILGLVFAPAIINFYIPESSAETKQLATNLTRILLIQPMLLGLSGFAMGILNALKIFGPSAWGSVVYSAGVIVFGLGLRPFLGTQPEQGVKAFALGVILGALGNFLVQIPALKRVGFKYTLTLNLRHPGVKRIAALALPMMMAFTFNQIMVVINQNLNSSLSPGSIAAFMYAYKLQQLPIGIFAFSIGAAVFPTMTELIAKKDWAGFRASFSAALRSIIFITVPITVGVIVLAKPLIEVVYQHGHFTAHDTMDVISPLVFFALGIVPQSAIVFLPRAFYALQETWTPVVLGIISLSINIVLMYLLVGPLQVGGLALAMSIKDIVNMLLLLYVLRRRMGPMDGKRIITSFLKVSVVSAAMGAVVYLVYLSTHVIMPLGKIGSLMTLSVGTLVGILVFVLGAYVLRMPELQFVANILKRKRVRNRAG
ncbi:MAG TPA: murein biosynthesis integral membrane protein MurJ [Verrucomicrobiae bacterium]|nr:murein biosynthesis integral membrane protein MurJ [Verrucomicrobiae bacterium]